MTLKACPFCGNENIEVVPQNIMEYGIVCCPTQKHINASDKKWDKWNIGEGDPPFCGAKITISSHLFDNHYPSIEESLINQWNRRA